MIIKYVAQHIAIGILRYSSAHMHTDPPLHEERVLRTVAIDWDTAEQKKPATGSDLAFDFN